MRVAYLALLVGGCVRQLPPRPIPEAVAPNIQGSGRLVIDVVDGPVAVQRVTMAPHDSADAQGRAMFRFDEEPQLLCERTPCVADVPPGNLLLGFPVIGSSSLDVELVHVDDDPSVYRRSLSIYNGHTGALRVIGIIAESVGSASAITGIVLLPIGLDKKNTGLTEAGGITLGLGALVTAFGIWAIRHDAPTYKPGSANHFSP